MISDPWIDRSAPPFYRTTKAKRDRSQARRDRLRALGKCLNGPVDGKVGRLGRIHGKPIKYGKCLGCLLAEGKTG